MSTRAPLPHIRVNFTGWPPSSPETSNENVIIPGSVDSSRPSSAARRRYSWYIAPSYQLRSAARAVRASAGAPCAQPVFIESTLLG